MAITRSHSVSSPSVSRRAITRSHSVSSPSVSRRASSRSRSSPPQRKRRITPQLQLFNEEEARLAAEGHRVTRRVKFALGRLISKGYKGERQREACAALRVHFKRINDRNRLSKRLSEEAEIYFEDFISNVEDTDFSSFDGERSDTSSTLGVTKTRDAVFQTGLTETFRSPAGPNSRPDEMDGVNLPWLLPVTPKSIVWDAAQMNKGKSHSSTTMKSPTNDGGKAGELFAAESLEEYAEFSRDNEDDDDSEDQVQMALLLELPVARDQLEKVSKEIEEMEEVVRRLKDKKDGLVQRVSELHV